jgi:hypothetical protein
MILNSNAGDASTSSKMKGVNATSRSSVERVDACLLFHIPFCYVSHSLHPAPCPLSSCRSFLSVILFVVFKNDVILKRKNISMRTRLSMDGRESTTASRRSDPSYNSAEVTPSLFCHVSHSLSPPSSHRSFLSIVLFLVFKNNVILKRKKNSKQQKS